MIVNLSKLDWKLNWFYCQPYRESWAIAQDKKAATKKAPSEDEAL